MQGRSSAPGDVMASNVPDSPGSLPAGEWWSGWLPFQGSTQAFPDRLQGFRREGSNVGRHA